MTRPQQYRADWKVVDVFDENGRKFALMQRFTLYAMEKRDDGMTLESHPLEKYKVEPVDNLSNS